ncbi:MAG: hypothetical protein HQK65_11850 [Desulfamplus sp.]|nr:hypothetical protein [Desulfamplus sp.]
MKKVVIILVLVCFSTCAEAIIKGRQVFDENCSCYIWIDESDESDEQEDSIIKIINERSLTIIILRDGTKILIKGSYKIEKKREEKERRRR